MGSLVGAFTDTKPLAPHPWPSFAGPISHHSASPQSNPQFNLKCAQKTHNGPPPQYLHVEPRLHLQKSPNLNSLHLIFFVNQRKSLKFPQKQKPHLVTHFSVCLRDLPFSELSPKNLNPKNLFKPPPMTTISANSHRP
jgi:hypothetical protein